MFSWEEDHRGFSSYCIKCICHQCHFIDDVKVDHLAEKGFSTVKLLLPPFLYWTLWRKSLCEAHIWGWERKVLCSTSLKGTVSINYMEVFCIGNWPVLPYIFI